MINESLRFSLRNDQQEEETVRKIYTKEELTLLAREMGISPDWSEPGEQGVSARVEGVVLANGGYWPTANVQPRQRDTMTEFHVVLSVDGTDVAAVNLSALLAWSSGWRN